MTNAPLIVSALFGPADFAFLDGLRRAHFPPERNFIAAHLTLFHHLAPSLLEELGRRLGDECRARPPAATLSEPMKLGRGVALRVRSEELSRVRERLAQAFEGYLLPQDRQGWRPHVTIQNKAAPAAANALYSEIARNWQSRPLAIMGLAAWWYRDGPWELASRHRFRG